MRKNRCLICNKEIGLLDKDFKIKQKLLYQDPDDQSLWANYGSIHICNECMLEVKNEIRNKMLRN